MEYPGKPGDRGQRIEHAVSSDAGNPRVTRRQFLRAAVAGGACVGVASLGYWGVVLPTSVHLPTLPAPPRPSYPPSARTFRSRPDLWSPLISVPGSVASAAAGDIFLTPATAPGPVIVDNTGAAVWIHPTQGKRAFNLRVGTFKGAPVLTWWEGTIVLGTGQGEYVIVDQSYREVARVRAGNGLLGDLHEFITTPEGTALLTAYEKLSAPAGPSGSQVLELIVQEVEIDTGKVLFEWRASDHVGFDESYVGASAGQVFDFFHVNSIDVEPDGNLLISARHTWAVYKIDRATGAVIWRLGGKKSDFDMGTDTKFAWQHDARRQPDSSITLFDDGSNGSKPPTENRSRGLVLDLDEEAFTARLRRIYDHPRGILAMSQGSMQPLANGNALVGWGDQPYFTEFDPSGSIVLDGRLPDDSTSYRALRYEWLGRPAEAPSVVAESSGEQLTVYVSWNGATDVASWMVVGGDDAGSLAPIVSQARAGFETAIVVHDRRRLIAVRALDASGGVLVESAPIVG